MTEVEQEAQGIKLSQRTTGGVPFFDEICAHALGRRRKKALQDGGSIVVEAEISGGELLFENRHAGEEHQRSALYAVRRSQPYLSGALEKRARNAAANVFGKSNRAVFEIEMEIRTVNGGVTNAVDALRIEFDGTDACVESAGGLGTVDCRGQRRGG